MHSKKFVGRGVIQVSGCASKQFICHLEEYASELGDCRVLGRGVGIRGRQL